MKEKLKSIFVNDHIFYGLIVIIFSVIAFNLGKLSTTTTTLSSPTIQLIEPASLPALVENTKTNPPKTIDNPSINLSTPENPVNNRIVASKNGTRYYLETCSGVKRIKPENVITFSTPSEAESAGYTKAVNCPGL